MFAGELVKNLLQLMENDSNTVHTAVVFKTFFTNIFKTFFFKPIL